MKRRNVDFCGKLRRPARKSKLITEGLYGNTYVYAKFLIVWCLVLFADFLLEFRFEYLWPFWLLVRSVYDSFKYQGLAFSVFFIFIALTSDMICFLFIPVHWLFFAASTYVWVQYIWQTERGICLPTISLWLIFVYIEASVRLKELKNLPFHLDLCRPFAAHCIGYPVVTLGFGFKSHISYKMRLRKQKEVAKENELYFELLHQALPQESCSPNNTITTETAVLSNSIANSSTSTVANGVSHTALNHSNSATNSCKKVLNNRDKAAIPANHANNTQNKMSSKYDAKKCTQNGIDSQEIPYMEHQISKRNRSNSCDSRDLISSETYSKDSCKNLTISSNKSISSQTSITISSSSKWNHVTPNCINISPSPTGNGQPSNFTIKKTKSILANNVSPLKDNHVARLEADIKKLKVDLQASRESENELKLQIMNLLAEKKSYEEEFTQLQADKEDLEIKLQNMSSARQQEKQTLSTLRKRLQEEKKSRTSCESQLATERKAREDENISRVISANKAECTESCKSRRKELENELKQLKRELKAREDQMKQIDNEAQSLRHYKDTHEDTEKLKSALTAMQDKNIHLENSLSAETRLKLDLFSALGEAKRQLEISHAHIIQKDCQIEELTSTIDQFKSRFAEVMAVMPRH